MDEFEVTSNPQGPDAPRQPLPRWLAILGVASVVVLVAGLIAWVASRGQDESADSLTAGDQTTLPAPIDASTTSTSTGTSTLTAPVTESVTTTTTIIPTTTTTSTTTTTTTSVPTTGPTGELWTVKSAYFDTAFIMERSATEESLTAYDGRVEQSGLVVRCVAVVHAGQEGWSEWCAGPTRAARFIVLEGINPWLVEVGEAQGDITLSRLDPTWSLLANSCVEPVVTLISAANLGSAVTTGMICVGDEAFLIHSAVFLQSGPPDGGGLLLEHGPEGWNTSGGGTSFPCENPINDGVDRCVSFGVKYEMSEAALPIPPLSVVPKVTDFVHVRDETAVVRGWVDDEIDPAELEAVVIEQLVDPDAEVVATVRLVERLGHGQVNLVVIEVPALDDSVRSTTWAIWISTFDDDELDPITRAIAWDSCARGLADSSTCV
jgi:hypothetical protein